MGQSRLTDYLTIHATKRLKFPNFALWLNKIVQLNIPYPSTQNVKPRWSLMGGGCLQKLSIW